MPRPRRTLRPARGRGHARDARALRAAAPVSLQGRRLLVVAGGTRTTASTRHRLLNYRPFVERDGARLEWVEYRGGRIESPAAALAVRLRFLIDLGRHADARDVVLVQKVLPPIP